MKPITCKFGCGTKLTDWDDKERKYVEADATLHTPERCKSIKTKKEFVEKANTVPNSAYTDKQTLERIERKLDTQIELLQSLLIKLGLINTAKQLQDDLESDPYHQEGPG